MEVFDRAQGHPAVPAPGAARGRILAADVRSLDPLPARCDPGRRPVTRSRPLTLALGAALLLSASTACSPPAGPRGVVLISIDSLRADHVGAYGYHSATRPSEPVTPALDRLLGAEGALFEHAVSTTSWTLPAHLALLTGLPNEVHGVRDLPDRLPADRRLLAEAYAAAGWRTFGIWSGPNLHPWFGFDRGFDAYVDASTAIVESPQELFSLSAPGDWNAVGAVHDSSHRGLTGPAIVQAFGDFARALDDERFFAFVHMWDVHYDYNAPAEFDRFFPGYEGPIDGQDFKGLGSNGTRLSQQDLARLLALYDAEIRYTDHNIERMLGDLASAGRLADTLVVVTSDHGEEFLERGALGHKGTLYEEVLAVPLMFRLPGTIAAGTRHGGLVSLLDVAPTLADWCDLPFPAVYGRSLRPILEGQRTADVRPVPLELTVRPLGIHMRGVHGGNHKWIRPEPERGLLYFDLAKDPRELAPIPARSAPNGEAGAGAARELWQGLDRDAERRLAVAADALPAALGEDLRKAGYLGEADDDVVPASGSRGE